MTSRPSRAEIRNQLPTPGSLRDKVALVTGAWGIGSIGSATALCLARAGADVVVSDIPHPPDRVAPEAARVNWQGIESVRAEVEAMGRRSKAIECDLSDASQIAALVETAIRTMGRVDILVNAARAFHSRAGLTVMEIDEAEWDWVMAVNLRGPLTTAKYVARAMIESGGGGSIINISSIAGKRPVPGNAAYYTSKAALNMLTRVMALEMAPHKIRVNAICPGSTSSTRVIPEEAQAAAAEGISYEEYRKRWLARVAKAIPMARVGSPEEIANVAYFLASDMSSFMTGQCLNVDGGVVMD